MNLTKKLTLFYENRENGASLERNVKEKYNRKGV